MNLPFRVVNTKTGEVFEPDKHGEIHDAEGCPFLMSAMGELQIIYVDSPIYPADKEYQPQHRAGNRVDRRGNPLWEHDRVRTSSNVGRKEWIIQFDEKRTAFILVVMILSMVVFAVLGRPTLLFRLLSRIVLIPVIVGISYEWLKFGAKHQHRVWMRVLLAPGLALQKLTTREPEDGMIEVAIAALERVLELDGIPVREGDPTLMSEGV